MENEYYKFDCVKNPFNKHKMNPFEGLQVDETDNEILTDKQLRNIKKKLKNKENKLKTNPSPELYSEITKLKILINEYENKDAIPKRPHRKKRKMKEKTEDEFDEEAMKDYRYNKKRKEQEKKRREQEKEKQEKQRQERREKERREEERKEREQYWREKRYYRRTLNEGLKSDVYSKDCPADIKHIYENWNKSQWKKLQIKYHPDKIGGDSSKCVILNNIKDYHENL